LKKKLNILTNRVKLFFYLKQLIITGAFYKVFQRHAAQLDYNSALNLRGREDFSS